MLNYAIIGFGGLGKTHFGLTQEVKSFVDVNLVALCDVAESAFSTQVETNLGANDASLDLSAYNLYSDADELFDNEKLDFIITALPTYIHEKIAVKAMERGIHVFSEKPMAINIEQGKNMIAKAKENNVKLMIGQCLRFWPEYIALKDLIDSEKYGKLVRADFSRFSQTPDWSWQNWMLDEEKSGAVVLDLHVHDLDYINWVFGMPKSVTSYATNSKTPHDSIQTIYNYDDERIITARADWGFPSCYPFAAAFTARFEKATVELKGGVMNLYPENGEASVINVPEGNAYVNEVVDFVNCINEDRTSNVNPPESSLSTIELAFAERKSADTHKTIEL